MSASIQDRDSDELAVCLPAEVMPLGRLGELDGGSWLTDVEIENVLID